MIPNCAATRHAHFVLDGSGPVALDPPRSTSGPTCTGSRRPNRGA
jgi:fumarate hydratase class I